MIGTQRPVRGYPLTELQKALDPAVALRTTITETECPDPRWAPDSTHLPEKAWEFRAKIMFPDGRRFTVANVVTDWFLQEAALPDPEGYVWKNMSDLALSAIIQDAPEWIVGGHDGLGLW